MDRHTGQCQPPMRVRQCSSQSRAWHLQRILNGSESIVKHTAGDVKSGGERPVAGYKPVAVDQATIQLRMYWVTLSANRGKPPTLIR